VTQPGFRFRRTLARDAGLSCLSFLPLPCCVLVWAVHEGNIIVFLEGTGIFVIHARVKEGRIKEVLWERASDFF